MSSTESIDTVDKLIKKFHLKTVETSKEIYFWDPVSGIYRPNGAALIGKELEAEYLRQYDDYENNKVTEPPAECTRKSIDEFIGHVERRTGIDISELNRDIEWLACADCMLNLKTGETSPFDPKYLNTTHIPVKYNLSVQ